MVVMMGFCVEIGIIITIILITNNNNKSILVTLLTICAQLGKSVETTDEEYQEFVANFNKQQVCRKSPFTYAFMP